jgi:hypothetical protein
MLEPLRHVGEVTLERCAQLLDAGRRAQGWLSDFPQEAIACGHDGGELQRFLRAEVREDAPLAHADLLRESRNRQAGGWLALYAPDAVFEAITDGAYDRLEGLPAIASGVGALIGVWQSRRSKCHDRRKRSVASGCGHRCHAATRADPADPNPATREAHAHRGSIAQPRVYAASAR